MMYCAVCHPDSNPPSACQQIHIFHRSSGSPEYLFCICIVFVEVRGEFVFLQKGHNVGFKMEVGLIAQKKNVLCIK